MKNELPLMVTLPLTTSSNIMESEHWMSESPSLNEPALEIPMAETMMMSKSNKMRKIDGQ